MGSKRSLRIQEILAFLEKEKITNPAQLYSINENICFFRNIPDFFKFLKWYRNSLGKIDGSKLTELTDFDNEEFIGELHQKLIKIERRKIPGLITPLVIEVCNFIQSLEKPALIADFGSGSMESTRQIISRLIKYDHNQRLTFVEFDKSVVSHELGIQNLSAFSDHFEVHKTNNFNAASLEKIEKISKRKINIILSNENIFELSGEKMNIKFDLVYHSFFKHHLEEHQKMRIDNILAQLSDHIFEYDEFYSSFGLFIHAIYTWNDPVLLNGAVFSILRSPALQSLKADTENVRIYKRGSALSWLGTYLKIR